MSIFLGLLAGLMILATSLALIVIILIFCFILFDYLRTIPSMNPLKTVGEVVESLKANWLRIMKGTTMDGDELSLDEEKAEEWLRTELTSLLSGIEEKLKVLKIKPNLKQGDIIVVQDLDTALEEINANDRAIDAALDIINQAKGK